MKLGLVVVALVAALWHPQAAGAQDAQDVVGTWESTLETPRGTVTQEYVFVLDDRGLTGTVSGRGGPVALEDVRYEDGTLTFKVVREMRGNSRVTEITAVVDGDTLVGTLSGGRGGSRDFSAKRRSP